MNTVRRKFGIIIAMCAMAAAMAATPASASEFEKFQNCPSTTEGVNKCLYSVTEGGSVKLGSKTVPIVNDVVLQGGFSLPTAGFSKFFAATGVDSLQKVAQPVPGGLAGLVNCKEITNFLLKAACEWTFENGLTGVNSILELARPASEIVISESNLGSGKGIAFKLPVKIRLENPFLGSNCYIGSSAAPVMWNLTSGTTSPPEGVEPIKGKTGKISFLEGGKIVKIAGTVLVDNTWAAPEVDGCGGLLSFLLDPIVSAASGLPAAAGVNVATLEATSLVATAAAVNANK